VHGVAAVQCVLGQPRLARLAVVHPQVVQDQVDLAPGAAHQSLEELDQDVGVQRPVEVLPAHLPAVGDDGGVRQPVALVVDPHHRRPALRREAATARVVAAQPGLVAPVDLGTLDLGAGGNHRVFLIGHFFAAAGDCS
jgi:hypothetical protein